MENKTDLGELLGFLKRAGIKWQRKRIWKDHIHIDISLRPGRDIFIEGAAGAVLSFLFTSVGEYLGFQIFER